MSDEQPDPLVGQLVAGRYRVDKRLGEGGMGAVYLAEHEAIEKKVALKVLHPEYSAKADIVERFQQEAKAASRIKHPNVLDIFDFGQLDNGAFYLAMEFLEGHDLADELLKTNILPVDRGLTFALQICRALAAAHSKGVVHRDMKPENVFILRTTDGQEIVKIVDFGIAQLRSNEEAAQAAESAPKRRKLTKTGMIFGTPEYMAPEQAAGKKADLRVDIYATGIILYEMFAGAVPHTGETFMAVLAAHLNEEPPPLLQVNPNLALSPEMQAVVMRALAKSPEHRFQSMAELAEAIAATPDAQAYGLGLGKVAQMASIPDTTASQFVTHAGAAAGTAAQFAPDPQAGTHAQFPGNEAPPPAPLPAAGRPAQAATSVDAQEADRISRADTHLEAAAPMPEPKKKSAAGAVAVVLGLLAVGGGVGAWVFMNRTPDEPPVVAAPPEPEPPKEPEEPVEKPPEKPPEPAAPKKFKIKIETSLEGATVEKNGFQVCDTTPCDIEANPDEAMTLIAKKGAATGKIKVLAQKDQTVKIKMVAPRARPPKPKGPRLCEVEVDGLKILRPCPN